MKKYMMIFISLMMMSSCGDKNFGVSFSDELVPYVELFKQEAALRGVVFDNNQEKIEGYLQNLNATGVAGVCRRHDEGKNRSILIDKGYWASANDLDREYVVFHELGHCFLEREHLDGSDDSGICLSIMYSGTGGCEINYTNATRSEFIDELFQ